jgi:hypothetical protein
LLYYIGGAQDTFTKTAKDVYRKAAFLLLAAASF